jgi:hypothetical protein
MTIRAQRPIVELSEPLKGVASHGSIESGEGPVSPIWARTDR